MILKGRTHHYLAGLASGYVVTLATIVVGLWLTPFTLRYLDREQFAVFVLASDVLMWLGLLEIGLTAVLNVQAAQLSARPDPDRLNRLASTTFFAQSAIALGIMAVGGVIALFPDFFRLRQELRQEGMQVMALMALGSALTVGSQTFSALLIAHQQIHVDNMIRLGLIIIRTALTVGLLMAGYGLLSLAVAHLTAVVITALFGGDAGVAVVAGSVVARSVSFLGDSAPDQRFRDLVFSGRVGGHSDHESGSNHDRQAGVGGDGDRTVFDGAVVCVHLT